MTIQELNSRFGAPGRIVFRDGFAGLPNVVLANKYGTAEIALFGANVVAYRPTGHSPVIFRSAKKDADYSTSESFHGGIPVCWPQFGNRFSKTIPQHGIVRKLLFEVRSTEYSEEKTEITLGIRSTDETKKVFPYDFDLEYKVSVTMKLNLTLKTKNTGKEPFAFSCAYHPYFLVRERNEKVIVRGLEGLNYVDGNTLAVERQLGDLKFDKAADFVYTLPATPKHTFAILDYGLGRAIAIASTGDSRLTVWNPGPMASPLSDLGMDDWKKFVCVEPVSDWPGGRTLAPGEESILAAAIQAQLKS